MRCSKSSIAISAIIDGAGSELELHAMAEHLDTCMACSDAIAHYRGVRQNLRDLPVRQPSPQLQTALREMASHDRARRIAWLKLTTAFVSWRVRVALMFKDLMQPVALPIAGGVISALMLFGALAPDMFVEVHPVRNDVPTVLFTNASVKEAYWPVIGVTDIVVDLTIDESGRLTDYSIVSGGPMLRDQSMRRRFESALLLTQFTPANFFGTPMSGKIRVSFRTSRIDIQG